MTADAVPIVEAGDDLLLLFRAAHPVPVPAEAVTQLVVAVLALVRVPVLMAAPEGEDRGLRVASDEHDQGQRHAAQADEAASGKNTSLERGLRFHGSSLRTVRIVSLAADPMSDSELVATTQLLG